MKESKMYQAVTAVLVCGDYLYMVKRNFLLPAFPGYHAFVGGKVDKTDAATPLDTPLLSQHDPRLMRALERELKEELDFNLSQAILNHEVRAVTEIGLAVTPDFNPVRFSTHFFRIDLTSKKHFHPEPGEILSGEWHKAQDFYQLYLLGKMLLVPPLITVLKHFSANPGVGKIEDLDFVYDQKNEVPCIESISGILQAMPLSNTLLPAERTNCFIIGDDPHHRLVIDPSPKNAEEKRKLMNVLKKHHFSAIFLTHHHPDHFEFSNDLAQEFGVPLMLSADSFQRLGQKLPGYFDQVKTLLVGEGEVVAKWKGEDVLTLAVPGHDEGQLALYSANRAWCIVGDLIQGMGTVVIGGDEGDMAKYMHSLQKVIDLSPHFILPSHGIAMGSTFRLSETLKHRQLRETQVFDLVKSKKSHQQILELLYPDIHPELKRHALSNIEKHLEKLKREGRV